MPSLPHATRQTSNTHQNGSPYHIPTLAVLPYNTITYYPMLNSNYFHHCWEQRRNEVRWRPVQEASLVPPVSNLKPCSNLRSQANVRPMFASDFGSKCTVLKKVLATLLELFGASRSHSAPPTVIRRHHNDSAPEKLFPLTPLRCAPGWKTWHLLTSSQLPTGLSAAPMFKWRGYRIRIGNQNKTSRRNTLIFLDLGVLTC